MPKVDWEAAPEGALWWAMDADGSAYWHFSSKIVALTDAWLPEEIPASVFVVGIVEPAPAPTFGFTGDWKESSAERPYGKGSPD